MKTRLPIYLFMSVILIGICYMLTYSFLYAGMVGVLSILTFLIIIEPLVARCINRHKKSNEAYHFINSFIVSLSASKSLESSFESAIISLNKEEKDALSSISEYPIEEKLTYLGKYFEMDIYKVFLSIIRLYEEEGGDILDLASSLLRENTSIEEERISHKKNILKALFQFSSLWFMSLLVMGILRFSLTTFYDSLRSNKIFILLILVYFLIALGSFVFFALAVTNEKITLKGALDYERKSRKKIKE